MQNFLNINIDEYESPLDLIYHLIELNHIDIYDIPIFDITEQYLSILQTSSFDQSNMELASEFLLMAATLMQIKSRMLLPEVISDEIDIEENDPREELVLRLLAYRRNKYMAKELEKKFEINKGFYLKNISSPQSLGLDIEIIEDKLNQNKFLESLERLKRKNALRFNSQNLRIKQLLKRQKFSVKDKMLEIIDKVFHKTRLFFSELFPLSKSSKSERISGFLAILELIRQDKIIVKQSEPFSVMMIELEENIDQQLLNNVKVEDIINTNEEEFDIV